MKVTFKLTVSSKIGTYQKNVPVDLCNHENKEFRIFSPYDPELVTELRSCQKAKWNPPLSSTIDLGVDGGYWSLPITERNVYAIKYLQGWRDDRYRHNFLDSNIRGISTDSKGSSIRPLFSHQLEGISFALARRHCMLGFEMGLGKTLTTIEIIERFTSAGGDPNFWLVAPYGAQQEWKRQLVRWQATVTPCVTTTYESLHKYMDAIDEPPTILVCDESIKIKNPNAQRSQIVAELCRLIRERHGKTNSLILFLSGAPASKDPTDWWHQIECLCPGFIREGDIFKFRNRLAIVEERDHGYGPHKEVVAWRDDEVEALGRRLSPIVLVKKKRDCFDLPDKIFDIITCKPNDKLIEIAQLLIEQCDTPSGAIQCMRQLSDGFRYTTEYVESDDSSLSGTSSRSTTWIGSPKLDIIKSLLDFYAVENGGPGRLIIYAVYQATIDKLCEYVNEHGWGSEKIDGRGWSNKTLLDVFDSRDADNVCIVAHPACVHGLSFVRTECLVYYSNDFSSDARIQSLDRRDRPGLDKEKATRIVDIIHLPTDKLILDRLNSNMDIQELTLQEIMGCLRQ